MPDLQIERKNINSERFDEELRALLGDTVLGLSSRRGQLIVHLRNNATHAHLEQVRQAAINHDPSLLSRTQQKQAQLQAERELYTEPLDPNTTENQSPDPVVNTLLERVIWLENEIRDLREI